MAAELGYEKERLLLHLQEALAEAIARSGLSRAEIASRLTKDRAFVTRALAGSNLTLGTVAALAWAAGFRVEVKLVLISTELRAETT